VAILPPPGQYVPGGQMVPLPALVWPGVGQNLPGAHGTVLPAWMVGQYAPGGHIVGVLPPSGQYVPIGHTRDEPGGAVPPGVGQ
jgi:hypothetical protein